MNCGIADIDNLSGKLAAVLQGWAGDSLLGTYETERLPIAEMTVDASLGKARPPASIEGLVLGSTYNSSATVPDGSEPTRVDDVIGDYVPEARPGHRAPHVRLGAGGTKSTLDLFGRTFVLITGQTDRRWTEEARRIDSVPVEVQRVDDPAWAKIYGIEVDGAVLVRPDGYVAWRSPVPPLTTDVLNHALNQAVGKTR